MSVCPQALIAGFVDVIAGGGGLISLPAYLIAGIPPHLSLGTNKLMSTIGSTVATIRYIKAGYVNFMMAAICIPFAFLGSALGSILVLLVSVFYLKLMLLVLLPISALFLLKNQALKDSKRQMITLKLTLYAASCAFLFGGYNGFYGPGTVMFLILALTSFAGMKLTIS